MDERTAFKHQMIVDAMAVQEELGRQDGEDYKRLRLMREAIELGVPVNSQPSQTDNLRTLPHGGARVASPRTEPKPSPGELRFIERMLEERDLIPAHPGGVNLPHVLLTKYEAGTLTRREARELGDWLKDCPYKGSAPAAPVASPQGVRGATPKQLASVVREGARRVYAGDQLVAIVAAATAGEFVSFSAASAALDTLFAAPFRPREQKPEPTAAEGVYARTETVNGEETRVFYKVQIAHHGSGPADAITAEEAGRCRNEPEGGGAAHRASPGRLDLDHPGVERHRLVAGGVRHPDAVGRSAPGSQDPARAESCAARTLGGGAPMTTSDGIDGMAPPFPEHDKLHNLTARSTGASDFYVWLKTQGYWLVRQAGGEGAGAGAVPVTASLEDLLAGWLGIDQTRLEEEKRQIQDILRHQREARQ